MRANLASLLQNVNIVCGKLGLPAHGIVFLDQIRKMQRASKPCRPRAHNQYIRFQLFALDGHGFAFIVTK